jgi:broad specificity phosphatase PhoE
MATNLTSKICDISEPVTFSSQSFATDRWVTNLKPYVIATVGLPARGKSYTAGRLNRWLNWKGLKSRVFNLGWYRRELYPSESMTHEWFDPDKEDQVSKREKSLSCCIDDLKRFFEGGGIVGIIDGTNSTATRRERLQGILAGFIDANRILWVEKICDDPESVLENILTRKVHHEDYFHASPSEVVEDFSKRIQHYEKNYTRLGGPADSDKKFIQIFNVGRKVILNQINSQLDLKLAYFLMNLHSKHITIYLTRHGESVAQLNQIIGTDSDLTERGKGYSDRLRDFIDRETAKEDKMSVFCSTLKRSYKTASSFLNSGKYVVKQWKQLDEINGGHFEGSTYSIIAEKWPKIYKLRQGNKYVYGWPGGESYQQMIARLENILLELERGSHPILIIAHQAICRGIYAYLMYLLPEECTEIEIKSHCVYKFSFEKKNEPTVTRFDLGLG